MQNTNTTLADCPESPNCVCTLASRDSQRMSPLRFEGSTDEALAIVKDVVRSTHRMKIVRESKDRLSIEARTLLFRFVDDVEIWLDEANHLLHFRSASRIGYSDMGANRKRMKKLCDDLLAVGFQIAE